MKRRMLALLMALVMVMGILPILPVHVHAEEGTCTHEAGNRYYRLYQQDTRYHQEYCGDCNTFIRLGQHAFGDGNAYCSADGCGYINPNCAHRNHGDYYYSAEGCVADCLDCGKRTAPIAHIPDSDCYGNNGDGTHIIMCERCNSSYATESHTFSEGACTKCGAADADYVAPHVHSPRYDVGAAQHRVLCNGCSEVVEGWEDHVYVDGRCECGASEEYPEPPAHTHTEAQRNTDEGHETYCTGCSEVLSVVPHDFTNGDCSCGQPCPHQGEKTYTKLNSRMDNVRCDVCGDDLESVLHNMEYLDIGMGIHFGECTQCRDKDIEVMEPHTFENDKCIYCNVDRVVNCTHTEYEERYIKSYPGHNVKCTGCDTKLREEDHTRGICVPKADDAAKHYVCCADCKGEYALESHKFDDPAHMGVCECGVLCPHEAWNWTTNSDGTMHKQICLICGQDKTEFTAHVLNDPEHKGLCDCGVACVHPNDQMTYTGTLGEVDFHDEYCPICEQTFEKVAHTPGDKCRPNSTNTSEHYILCQYCGGVCATAPHHYVDGFCDAEGCGVPCPDCLNGTNRAYAPDPENAIICVETCGTCGKLIDDTAEHEYKGTDVCTRCQEKCTHSLLDRVQIGNEPEYHNDVCHYCGYRINLRQHHDFNSHPTKPYTCACDLACPHPADKQTYEKTYENHTLKCDDCGMTKVETTKHSFGVIAGRPEMCAKCYYTCPHGVENEPVKGSHPQNHDLKCKNCGVGQGNTGHVFGDDDICDDCTYKCTHSAVNYDNTKSPEGHTAMCNFCELNVPDGFAAHSFVENAEGEMVCSVCEYVCLHGTKTYSNPFNRPSDHRVTCELCKKIVNEHEGHSYNGDNICDVCKYECKHVFVTYSADEFTHTAACDHCGQEATEKSGDHEKFVDENGKWVCKVCKYECKHSEDKKEYDAYNHNTFHKVTCGVCEKELATDERHVYSGEGDTVCDKCGQTCTYHTRVPDDLKVTALNDSQHKVSCKICNYEENKDHEYDNERRCTVAGCNKVCGHEGTEVFYKNGGEYHNVYCDSCKKLKDTRKDHDFTTGNAPSKCVCGASCPHTDSEWTKADGLHTQYCNDCEEYIVLDQPHDFKGATPGTCVCGEVCDHSSITEWGELDFNTKHTAVCPGCGETVTASHTPVPGSVRPLAEGEKGQAEYVHHAECQVCGKSYNEAHNSSNGGKCTCGHCSHSTRTMTAWDANGHAMTCAVCGDVKTTAHIPEDFNDGVCKISGCEYKCPHSNMTYSEDKTTWSCPDCDMKDVPHTHEYVGEQVPGVYLNSHHRVKCVCGDAKSNLETHKYSGNVCTVCSYDKTATNP